MILKKYNHLILLSFTVLAVSACAPNSKKSKDFSPYLENTRDLQIPQWEHENWYIEDWTAQKPADQIISDLYKADIFRDYVTDKTGKSTLIVGPNFYHLSGLDKRRVVTLFDHSNSAKGMNSQSEFFLKDWRTKKYIGAFDQQGLRLN